MKKIGPAKPATTPPPWPQPQKPSSTKQRIIELETRIEDLKRDSNEYLQQRNEWRKEAEAKGPLIEELKEALFKKSLECASLQGTLDRVEKEDYMRDQVVPVDEFNYETRQQMTKQVLKLDLAKVKYTIGADTQLNQAMSGDWRQAMSREAPPKHWVNKS